MLRRPFRRVRLFLEFNWPVLFLSCHASIHPMAAFINSPPPLALNKVAPPPAPGVPISPRSTTPPSSPRKSTIVNLSNASTTSMVEKANPTVCIELLLHLEVRIRVSGHTPEKVRNTILNALRNSFFKPSEDKFQFKGEIQMWQIKLHPYLLAGHLPSISTFLINTLSNEGYIMAGQTSIDVNKTDWVFWFTPLPHQHGISTSPQPPPAVHK